MMRQIRGLTNSRLTALLPTLTVSGERRNRLAQKSVKLEQKGPGEEADSDELVGALPLTNVQRGTRAVFTLARCR